MAEKITYQELKEPQNMRLKFKKVGKMKYISHLDLNRTFIHAFLRADIPIWHTEGFNPHPKIIFSLPLSIGTESISEFLDFKVTHNIGAKAIKTALNKALPEGIEIIDAYIPKRKFSAIKSAGYEFSFTSENINESTAAELEKLFSEPLFIKKVTKNNEKIINLNDFCEVLEKKITKNSIFLRIKLSASDENFMRTDFVTNAIKERCPYLFADENYTQAVLRYSVFADDGEFM